MRCFLSVYKIFLLVITLLHFLFLSAQKQQEELGKSRVETYSARQERISLSSSDKKKITAIAIKAKRGTYQVRSGDSWLDIPPDPDVPGTWFVSLPVPLKNVEIRGSESDFEVYLIKSGDSPKVERENESGRMEFCEAPPSLIPQSQWRSGLPAPSYERTFTNVDLLIVHHSAGSNAATDFVQVVRDIYLYHTEVNGWSDIGYNYLIAQDGTLFAGRDPGGGNQISVRGAHFCGSNSGTSGICLLGNYETTTPTFDAFNRLTKLLTYTSLEIGLDPVSTATHPTGIQNTISGHRDGCSTLCPGENLYTQLDRLREEVDLLGLTCIDPAEEQQLSFVADSIVARYESVLFSNTSTGYEEYFWEVENGKIPLFSETETPDASIRLSFDELGFKDVKLIGRFSNDYDTLERKNYLLVTGSQDQPRILPNPVSPAENIRLDFKEAVTKIHLRDLNGKLVESIKPERNTFTLPFIEPGMYLLEIFVVDQRFTGKLLIQ